MVKEVSSDNFEVEVLKEKGIVLVDFNADWCGPCKMLRPVLDEVASSVDSKIVSVNVDNNSDIAKKYGVSSIPCLVVFKDGKEVNRSVGFMPRENVEELLEVE